MSRHETQSEPTGLHRSLLVSDEQSQAHQESDKRHLLRRKTSTLSKSSENPTKSMCASWAADQLDYVPPFD
jgi:hypothetical protein